MDDSYKASCLTAKFHVDVKQRDSINSSKAPGRLDSRKQAFYNPLVRNVQLNSTEANRGRRVGWTPLLLSLFTAKDRTLCHLGNHQQRQCVKL